MSIFYCPSVAVNKKFPLTEFGFFSDFKKETLQLSEIIMERLHDVYRLCHCGDDLEAEDGWFADGARCATFIGTSGRTKREDSAAFATRMKDDG